MIAQELYATTTMVAEQNKQLEMSNLRHTYSDALSNIYRDCRDIAQKGNSYYSFSSPNDARAREDLVRILVADGFCVRNNEVLCGCGKHGKTELKTNCPQIIPSVGYTISWNF